MNAEEKVELHSESRISPKEIVTLVLVAAPFSWLVNEIFRTVVPKLFVMSTLNEWYLMGDWITTAIRQFGYFVSVLPLVIFVIWMTKLRWLSTLIGIFVVFLAVQGITLSLSDNYDSPLTLLISKSYLWMYFYITVCTSLMYFGGYLFKKK